MIFKKKQSVDSLGKVKGNENQGFEPGKHEIQDKVEIIKQNQDSGKTEQKQDGGELLFGHCENNKECKEKETKGQKVVLHGLVSFCLVFIVFVVIVVHPQFEQVLVIVMLWFIESIGL